MTCLTLLGLAAVLTLPPDTGLADDLQQFQGVWNATTILNGDGDAATPDELARTRLIVVGDRFTLEHKNYTLTGRFIVAPNRSPATIDVVLDGNGSGPPMTVLGIYRIEGESRRSCFALPGERRPVRFPISPKGFIQFEWKRSSNPVR